MRSIATIPTTIDRGRTWNWSLLSIRSSRGP
jgi:hypothetical protein